MTEKNYTKCGITNEDLQLVTKCMYIYPELPGRILLTGLDPFVLIAQQHFKAGIIFYRSVDEFRS